MTKNMDKNGDFLSIYLQISVVFFCAPCDRGTKQTQKKVRMRENWSQSKNDNKNA